ncbi:MAG: HlyD family efflux transporter periplasmic adaptor subunit [Methyloceanibacter sp.]|nr:HlyD family efflux transporter periplasmic adaptor subunit [Methyloceanibacter sp.]
MVSEPRFSEPDPAPSAAQTPETDEGVFGLKDTEPELEAYLKGPARNPRRRKRRFTWILSGLLLSAAGVLAYWYISTPQQASVGAAPARPVIPAVVGLGFLEPSSTIIKVGAPGSPDGSRIKELKVQEGDEVEAGEVLAVLDTQDRLAAQLEASKADVALKQLMLQRQKLEIAYTIEARRAALERARASLESASAEYDRQKALLDRRYGTPSNVEKKKMEMLTADATVRETVAGLARIQATVNADDGAESRLIDVALSEQELAAAQAAVKVAMAELDQSVIRAPFNGRVIELYVRTGERIGSDGLLEIGATNEMRAVVEVYETDIGRVRLGQRVTIRARALGGSVTGTVERIGAAIKRQSVVNNDPATATDARVAEVFVALDEDTSRKVANLSRLQVEAVFEK